MVRDTERFIVMMLHISGRVGAGTMFAKAGQSGAV